MNQQDDNDLHSKSMFSAHLINTGITYLPLPELRLQLAKPQQTLDYKHQIEQDFYARYRHMDENEFDEILGNIDEYRARHFKSNYRRLYENLLLSILRSVDFDDEILRIKHALLYNSELLPILNHNHKLAKREKRILYNLTTKTWQKFDECIQSEIYMQYQLKQCKQEHESLLQMKIKQEQHQKFALELQEMSIELIYLRKEIQQLHDVKYQLEMELHETRARCSHYLIHLNYLQTNTHRSHTIELNNLQLERDSIITQTELLKYNLFEQMQQYHSLLHDYRASLDTFRSTLSELEQQLKQQTDREFSSMQIFSSFQRQTTTNDTQQLIYIFENKIDEKKSLNRQLERTIESLQEKIYKLKQTFVKKDNDYQTMLHNEQQFNEDIKIHREIYIQLKTERRSLEHQLATKLKQYSADDRLHHTLAQQHDSFIARKKLEQIRINTSTEQLHSLLDENNYLETFVNQLYQQYTQTNPNNLSNLQIEIEHLKQTRQTLIQHKIRDRQMSTKYKTQDEQLQIKNNRIVNRIRQILNRVKENDIVFKANKEHIHTLENQLKQEQNYYLQSKYLLTRMKNRSEVYRTKQHSIQMQIQIAINSIKHSQHYRQTFAEQLSICKNDLLVQQVSLNKLREFHTALQEQLEMNSRKLFTIHTHVTSLRNQYKNSVESLEKIREDVKNCLHIRSSLGRMIIRRIDLCQLLYKKLARYDQHIHQQDRYIQIITKCIYSLKSEIHQLRRNNQKFLEKKDHMQLETVKVHMEKLLDQSYTKQQTLTKQIFQRRVYTKLDRLPSEDLTFLKTKFYMLKTRYVKIICREILCNFVLVAIQQEYFNYLRYYTCEMRRDDFASLNVLRRNLCQLMKQLKAKTAENNILINYYDWIQWIRIDIIQRIAQWSDNSH
ncbi:unnamed protein product [Adineta ricciae]|uniref:Uncharacterized protein n=1 Tax=Adineta ricciae TaxID=249248 RepID=A0A813Q216_ADIRI|nr:unnamed protein product [Adineta ricciae]